ncbi:MAG TPA: molybdopterin converting factor subunit 1 [Bacillota bacterium]|nr:molybdopterin converting factor subunit 1 [Bacillota bacterium]
MIHILLFASLQEKLGVSRLNVEIETITVKELKHRLKDKYNLLEIDHAMVAVNEEYASEEETIHSGDTVAFIPPVSGG